jgi:hypothetical protein
MRRSGGFAVPFLCSGLLLIAGYLVVERGGLIAWSGVILAGLLLVKTLRWPTSRDMMLVAATFALWASAWAMSWYYVVSMWESGEVVDVEIGGEHTVRVWVLDMKDGPTMYYDAPPGVARSLLAGVPMSVTRAGHVQRGCASTTRVEDVSEEQALDVYRAMEEKYQGRNQATEFFYAVLGAKRNRIDVLVRLAPCP